jgi:hypothetical protein
VGVAEDITARSSQRQSGPRASALPPPPRSCAQRRLARLGGGLLAPRPRCAGEREEPPTLRRGRLLLPGRSGAATDVEEEGGGRGWRRSADPWGAGVEASSVVVDSVEFICPVSTLAATTAPRVKPARP